MGTIVSSDERERIQKLIVFLSSVLEERKKKCSKQGFDNIVHYRKATNEPVPDIIIFVDNIGTMFEMYASTIDFVKKISESGANYGLFIFGTASAENQVPVRIRQNIKHNLALQMNDKSDYISIVGRVPEQLPAIPGIGYEKGQPPLIFQTALPADGSDDLEVTMNLKETIRKMKEVWIGGSMNDHDAINVGASYEEKRVILDEGELYR